MFFVLFINTHSVRLTRFYRVDWLTTVYETLDRIKLHSATPPRENQMLQSRLKVVSIVLNVLVDQLMYSHGEDTRRLLEQALQCPDKKELFSTIETKDPVLAVVCITCSLLIFRERCSCFVAGPSFDYYFVASFRIQCRTMGARVTSQPC